MLVLLLLRHWVSSMILIIFFGGFLLSIPVINYKIVKKTRKKMKLILFFAYVPVHHVGDQNDQLEYQESHQNCRCDTATGLWTWIRGNLLCCLTKFSSGSIQVVTNFLKKVVTKCVCKM